MKKFLRFLLAPALAASLLFSGCSTAASSSPSALGAASSAGSAASTAASKGEAASSAGKEPVVLTLAAAASLEDIFETELIPAFEKQYPWVSITGSYASSGSLQTQIEEGLAADIFMSAAKKQMDALVAEGLMDKDSVVELLQNEIVLILPAGSPLSITSFEEIGKAASIAMGDPESVPVGQYAKEALENLGLWEEIQPKLSLGTDVTQVLNWVAEGSAEAGIVYATDAKQMPDKVTVAASAPSGSLAAPVVYPVATSVLPEASKYEEALLFLRFLQSPEAMSAFEAKGFTPLTTP